MATGAIAEVAVPVRLAARAVVPTVTVNVAVYVPAVDGAVNVTPRVQLAPAARLVPQVSLGSVKSPGLAPLNVGWLTHTDDAVPFIKVSV